jgi:hypothetical protein
VGALTGVGFSGEIQGSGVEGLLSRRERSFKTLHLPCEIANISQDRPILASEFTESGQEEAGKGLKFVEGVPSMPPLSGRKQPFT